MWPYIFEFFTVLLSVYLAFLITEWRENYKIQKEVKVARERLDQEILDNYNNLIDFDRDVNQRYTKLLEVEAMLIPGKAFHDYVSHFNGYRLPTFKKVAWQRVVNSHLVHLMPVEYMDEVNRIYWSNQILEDMPKQNNDVFIGENVFDKERAPIAYNISRIFVWQQRDWGREYLKKYYHLLKMQPELLEQLKIQDSLSYRFYQKQDRIMTAREEAKARTNKIQLSQKKAENTTK
jgi:hypothetical protein